MIIPKNSTSHLERGLYGFGIVIAQTIRFLSILCPNLAGYSYTWQKVTTEGRKSGWVWAEFIQQ